MVLAQRATLQLSWVRLTEGHDRHLAPPLLPVATACDAEWFPEPCGPSVHTQAGQSVSGDGDSRRNSSFPIQQRLTKHLLHARLGAGVRAMEIRA